MSQRPIPAGSFNPMTGQVEPGTFTPPTEPLVSAGGDWWDQQGVPQSGGGRQYTGPAGPAIYEGMPPAQEAPRPSQAEIDQMLASMTPEQRAQLDEIQRRADDPNLARPFAQGGGKNVGTLPSLPSGPYHQMQGNGATGGTGQYQPFNEAVMRSILEKYTPDYAGVRRASEEIDRTFGPGVVKLLDHPTKLDKFQLPNGQVIDTVIGAGAPGASWTWAPEGGGGGGATLGGVMGGGVGNLLGSPMAGRSITDDPSYRFRFDEGLKALERSAAAKGTLLTGGMMKALTRYGQDVASTEYQNAYARAASEQGNNFNRLFSVAGMGLTGTNNAQQLASGYASSIGNGQLAAGNAQAAGTAGQANAWANTVGNLGNIAGQTNWVRKPGTGPNGVPYQPGEI